jgi:Uma2 family endonuclease
MIQKAPLEEDLVTFDEFCTLVPDGQKADLIDGVIYMASPDTRRSNNLTKFLSNLISDYLDAKNLDGEVFVTRYSFQLSETNAPEPDVAFVGPARLHLVKENRMDGGPDIAVEIVSRDSRNRDYGEKRELYQAAGVSEHWIVDPLQRRVEFLRLSGGKYELVPLEDNRIFRSAVIPGLWLNVEWLLAKPVPRAYSCLQEVLTTRSAM